MDRTIDSLINNRKNQLILIEGEAGTRKTVLTTSSFYEIIENEILKNYKLKNSSYILVNHKEQLTLYKDIAKKLAYRENIVQNPTYFLNHHSASKKADLVFVDESHLLWNQNNRGYTKKFKEPQLDGILKSTRVMVIMSDENQIVHKQ